MRERSWCRGKRRTRKTSRQVSGSGCHPDLHRGRGRGPVLAAALDGIAPDGEEGEAFEGRLAALAEGDGLAAMVGAGVADEQIGEVDGEERVAAGAAQRWRR